MKGLTPEEYETLAVAKANPDRIMDGSEVALHDLLVEQGRMTETPTHYHLAPAGREALRLWPLLRERFSRVGSK